MEGELVEPPILVEWIKDLSVDIANLGSRVSCLVRLDESILSDLNWAI